MKTALFGLEVMNPAEKAIFMSQVPLIVPPASRLLLRGPGGTSPDWVRVADLPRYAGLAKEYHRIDGYWLPLEADWMDANNWTVEGYWRPAK